MSQVNPPETVHLTVEDAIAKYKSLGVDEGYRALIEYNIDNETQKPFANDSYYDALCLTETMLDRTQYKINILTGCGCGGFYSTLYNHLTVALERIKINKGELRMLVTSDSCPEWLGALAAEFEGVFSIGLMGVQPNVAHFIVCDSRIVRRENIHGELTKTSSAHEIKAEVYFNNPNAGAELEKSFDKLWSEAKIDAPRKNAAPSWLIQQMDVLRQMRPPTSDKVAAQLEASIAHRQKSKNNVDS